MQYIRQAYKNNCNFFFQWSPNVAAGDVICMKTIKNVGLKKKKQNRKLHKYEQCIWNKSCSSVDQSNSNKETERKLELKFGHVHSYSLSCVSVTVVLKTLHQQLTFFYLQAEFIGTLDLSYYWFQ